MSPHTGAAKIYHDSNELASDNSISNYNKLVGKMYMRGCELLVIEIVFSSSYWFHNSLFDSNVTKMSGFNYLSDIADEENQLQDMKILCPYLNMQT